MSSPPLAESPDSRERQLLRKRQFVALAANLWLAAVVLMFFFLRIAGSNTAQHLLKRWPDR